MQGRAFLALARELVLGARKPTGVALSSTPTTPSFWSVETPSLVGGAPCRRVRTRTPPFGCASPSPPTRTSNPSAMLSIGWFKIATMPATIHRRFASSSTNRSHKFDSKLATNALALLDQIDADPTRRAAAIASLPPPLSRAPTCSRKPGRRQEGSDPDRMKPGCFGRKAMSATTTVPVTITPEAAARLAELGLQAQLETDGGAYAPDGARSDANRHHPAASPTTRGSPGHLHSKQPSNDRCGRKIEFTTNGYVGRSRSFPRSSRLFHI